MPYGITWIGITHQGAWEAAGRNWDNYLQRAVGTGPWKLESFSIRERAVLARNPDYWEAARVPKLGKVLLLPLPEPNTRVAALRSNQVDFIEAPPSDAIPALRQAGLPDRLQPVPAQLDLALLHGGGLALARPAGAPRRQSRRSTAPA